MPTSNTLRALVEAAQYAARATARRREAAGLAKKQVEFLQAELFPPPEVVGGVTIPSPRLPRAGEPSWTMPVSPGPSPMPAPFRDLLPVVSRKLPRAARQLELLPASRQPVGEDVRALLPKPDMAAAAEKVIGRITRQFQRRQPLDVGGTRTPTPHLKVGRPSERQLSPQDLRQEALRLIQARTSAPSFPLTPAELSRYLYPKVRKTAIEQVRSMTRPVRVPEAEQRILSLEQRISKARERDPRFAALSPNPTEILRKLAQDPSFAKTLKRTRSVRYFSDPSRVHSTLESGLPSASREATPGVWLKPDPRSKSGMSEEILRSGGNPLDELLAKQADETAFTGPMARMELALRALTDKQREVVTRVMGLGRPKEGIREVARDMKVSAPTVHQHYRTGLAKLQAASKAAKPAAPASKPAAVEAPKRTAKEIVEERLKQARARIETKRRLDAGLRQPEPPKRTWKPSTVPSRTFEPTDPRRLAELTKRYWERRSQ